MSEWRQLHEVASTNPEALAPTTERDYRFRYVDLSTVDKGRIHWASTDDFSFIDAPSRARRVVRPGDVLFGTVRPALQSHGYIDYEDRGPVVVSTGFSVIRAIEGAADPQYLRHYVLSPIVLHQAVSAAVGSNYPAVNDGDVRKLLVFVPPLVEQSAIAHILDTLDTQIEKTQALIAKLEQVKEGLLHDLLTRGVDENGELRPRPEEAPNLYKESALGLIPQSWEAASLVSVSTFMTIGPFGSDLVASDYRTQGVPVVFVRDIRESGFIWKSNVYITAEKSAALSSHSVTAGDVVLTKMGLPPCVACVYPEWMPDGVITADIVRVRVDSDLALGPWVATAMNSNRSRQQVQAITGGVTRPKVTLRDVRGLIIPMPSIDEQSRILVAFGQLDERSAAEQRSLRTLDRAKQGLMDDLLTGRVRVTSLLERETAEAI